MILIVFHILHILNTGAENLNHSLYKLFYFPKAPDWVKVLCNDCIIRQLSKPYPHQEQIAEKQVFKGQTLYLSKN